MEEEKVIDQSQLANSVSEQLKFEMKDAFLVKPLDKIKVKKEFTKLPENKEATVKDGVEAIDVEESEMVTEVKEVDSDFRKGVVIKVPYNYKQWVSKSDNFDSMPINPGDIVIYRERSAQWFDLVKDSHLIRPFDIIAVEHD